MANTKWKRDLRGLKDLLPHEPGTIGRVVFRGRDGGWVVSTEVKDDGTVIVHNEELHNRLLTPGGMQGHGDEPD